MSNPGVAKSGRSLDQWPVLALGFRPFYMVAALFAAVAVPVWIASYTGYLQPVGYLRGIEWHSHEMIFGFAPAVIAGFLLTAVRNWTGLPTASGLGLAGLFVLWMLPVAYAWIPITFVLRTLSQFSLVPAAVAIHALTIGAMSSLMVAMMTRSALGHTGRPLKAGPVEMIAFIGLQVAAFVRIMAALVLPRSTLMRW